jgi:hypothetical protein
MHFQDDEYPIESEDDLLVRLKMAFANDKTKRVIQSLIAQAKA